MNTMLITGGSDGLGKALAKRFSSQYKVIITSRSEKNARESAEELQCDGIAMDIRSAQSIKDGVHHILNTYGKIDCLINNAGIWIEGKVENNSEEEIQKVIETNLLGVLFVTKTIIPSMKSRRHGIIININSQNGLQTKKERSIYTASKWGITGFTKSLQEELSEHGIKVMGLYPGKMNTLLFSKAGIEKKMDDAIDIERAVDAVEFMLSMPDDVLITEIGMKSLQH